MAKTAYLALATETIHPGHLRIIKKASSLALELLQNSLKDVQNNFSQKENLCS